MLYYILLNFCIEIETSKQKKSIFFLLLILIFQYIYFFK